MLYTDVDDKQHTACCWFNYCYCDVVVIKCCEGGAVFEGYYENFLLIHLPIDSVTDKSIKVSLFSSKKLMIKGCYLMQLRLQFLEKGELHSVSYVFRMITDSLTKRGPSSKQLLGAVCTRILPVFMPSIQIL